MKRIPVIFSVFLAACAPLRVDAPPAGTTDCRPAPTASEVADWRQAESQNTRSAYRAFLLKYPRSCYAPLATTRMQRPAQVRPAPVRRLPAEARLPEPQPAY